MSSPFHNLLRVLFIFLACILAAASVGGPLVYLGGESSRMAGMVAGGVAAFGAAWLAAWWFEGAVPAKCPKCGREAWATTEGRRTRYRCERCGLVGSE